MIQYIGVVVLYYRIPLYANIAHYGFIVRRVQAYIDTFRVEYDITEVNERAHVLFVPCKIVEAVNPPNLLRRLEFCRFSEGHSYTFGGGVNTR